MNSPCGCQALANIISRFDSLSSIPRWCHNAICHRRIDTERHHHSPSWNAYPRGAFSIINRPVFAARRGIGMRERERERIVRRPLAIHENKRSTKWIFFPGAGQLKNIFPGSWRLVSWNIIHVESREADAISINLASQATSRTVPSSLIGFNSPVCRLPVGYYHETRTSLRARVIHSILVTTFSVALTPACHTVMIYLHESRYPQLSFSFWTAVKVNGRRFHRALSTMLVARWNGPLEFSRFLKCLKPKVIVTPVWIRVGQRRKYGPRSEKSSWFV